LERARRERAFYQELAGHIPLRVPRLLATHDDSDAICLLLAAYQPSPPARLWQAYRYLEVAEQLARLHAAFWNQTDRLSRYPWLRRPGQETLAADVQQAGGYWRALREQPRFLAILTEQDYRRINALVSRMAAVAAVLESLPLTLCHGDCNTGNLLRDADGNWLWADWQEVGLGRGPEDLTFLFQRASFDGGIVPYAEAIAAYQERLEAATGERIPVATVQRVLDAAELWTRLLHWPPHLTQASEEQLAAMLRRINCLAERLLLAP